MTHRKGITNLMVAVLILVASAAQADVINGDFENGSDAWQVNVPANWTVTFPIDDGNPFGHARIQSPFGGPGGLGCVMQTFVCGDPGEAGDCRLSVDYFLEQIDASDDSARIVVRANGQALTYNEANSGWHTVEFTVPCGVVVLELCLEVDPQNNGWRAGFDNVTATCEGGVAGEATSWGTVKSLHH